MISKIGNPDIFSPSKNPLYWYFDSTNKNEEGFKYLIDVYSANTLTVLQQYSVWPRPDDKYCEIGFTGLKDYCTKSINQILSGFSTCPETHVKYDVKVGEEYVFYWDYDDFYFANAVLSASSYGSNVVLSSFTEDHLYVVGDVINVVQDSLTGQTNIDGVQVVVEVPNARCIVLGLLFTTSAGAIGGTVTYSDLHKTQYSGLTSYTQYIAFNGSVTYKDFIDYDSNDYLISTATTGQFLTNAPSSYPVRSENNIYLNFYSLSSQTQATFLFISTSDGGLYRIPQGSLTANSNSIMTVNVGPSDYPSSIVAVSGTLPPIKSSTTYFDVYLTTSALIKSSETRRFAIEDNCYMYTNKEIYFIDQLGSLIPVNFQLNNERSYDYERNMSKKSSGNLVTNKYAYDSTEEGTLINSIVEKQKLTLYKDQLSSDERIYLRELIASKNVYIKEDGKLWPVIITDTNYKELTEFNENWMPFVLNIMYANNNIL